jgi:hypothetical protein
MLNEVKHLACEREVLDRSERSLACGAQILRYAQDDRVRVRIASSVFTACHATQSHTQFRKGVSEPRSTAPLRVPACQFLAMPMSSSTFLTKPGMSTQPTRL